MLAEGAPLWKFCAGTPRASKGQTARPRRFVYFKIRLFQCSHCSNRIDACVFFQWSTDVFSHFLESKTHLCSCYMATIAFLCSNSAAQAGKGKWQQRFLALTPVRAFGFLGSRNRGWLKFQKLLVNKSVVVQLIGLRENLQENAIFHAKIYGFL